MFNNRNLGLEGLGTVLLGIKNVFDNNPKLKKAKTKKEFKKIIKNGLNF